MRRLDQRVDDVLGLEQRRELGRDVGPVALDDRLDDGFLGGKVAIERARAHAGFGADRLHAGGVETAAGEAADRGVEDAPPLVLLALEARIPVVVLSVHRTS